MTTSEITNLERENQNETLYKMKKTSPSSGQGTLIFLLKFVEYLLSAAFICTAIVIYIFSNDKNLVIIGIVTLIALIFLFLFNREVLQNAQNAAAKYNNLTRKAEIYTYLLNGNNSYSEIETLVPAREKALQYSQELINDYKKSRDISRTLYYILQIATVVLSGVTPILVLVDKLEAGQAWLKWLPVICPAVASIVASIVTSFPFQKNWVAANTVVELLEAEQEKFILGVTSAYRCYDIPDPVQQHQKASQALEQFIIQVNNIHLQQVQQSNESQDEKRNKVSSDKSTPSTEEKSILAESA